MKTITPSHSPWGHIQHEHVYADGVVQVDTASHGGFWLSFARLLQMPREFHGFKTYAGGSWFEEDCDATLVVLSFPELFKPEWVKSALTFQNDAYFTKTINVAAFLLSDAGKRAVARANEPESVEVA